MLKFIFTSLLIAFCAVAEAQDTSNRVLEKMTAQQIPPAMRDTNKIAHDAEGNSYRYYQYSKMMNTGDYAIAFSEGPLDPKSIITLTKMDLAEAKRRYEKIKSRIEISVASLRPGITLDITPFLVKFQKADFTSKKAVILFYWQNNCPPCNLGFDMLNSYVAQIPNPNDVLVICIAVSFTNNLFNENKYLPNKSSIIKVISGPLAQAEAKYFGLSYYPAFVVLDKNLLIRYSQQSFSSAAVQVFKDAANQLLAN